MNIPWRRLLLSAVVATLSVSMSLPALAQEVTHRQFEEDLWDEDPANVDMVAEELGLVDLRSLDLSRTELRGNGFAGKSLRVRIPTDGFRGFGPFDRLEPTPDQAWFRYHLRLLDWNAAFTGKLPGLAGIYSSSGRGCIRSTETRPGWSARGMFGVPGTQGAPPGRVPIGTYLYHVDQAGDCGDGLWWGASLEQGRWYCVEGMVKMNTPGENDGQLRGWLNGHLELKRNNIQFRRAGETQVGVRHMWHDIYFGGSWPTPNPLALEYDEVAVSTTGRVGCLPPFTDIGSSIHKQAIVGLHAYGLLYGCGYRKACPFQDLSRGEAAALISRILDLPPATKDYFKDDQGNTFEDVINRIAAARITLGCAPGLFCPDRTMTRAEFAAMLVRALDLEGPAPDFFYDDDGHWGEDDINIFAQAGLTKGCGDDRFCPDRTLPRDEASAFFYRALPMLRSLDQAAAQPPPDWPPPGEPPPIPPEEQD